MMDFAAGARGSPLNVRHLFSFMASVPHVQPLHSVTLGLIGRFSTYARNPVFHHEASARCGGSPLEGSIWFSTSLSYCKHMLNPSE